MNRYLPLLLIAVGVPLLLAWLYYGALAIVSAAEQLEFITSWGADLSLLTAIAVYVFFAPAGLVLTYMGATTVWGWESAHALLLTLPGIVFFLIIVATDVTEVIFSLLRRGRIE